MVNGISIIVCTFNGTARLKPTIEHLADQELRCDTELILVDNASTDGSASFVEEIWKEKGNPYPLVIVNEMEPGLIHARKAGLKAARNDIVVFCDDDNWLQSDYLSLISELFNSMPDAGFIGGQGIGVTDGEFPSWWYGTDRPGNYAVGKQLPRSGNADKRGYLWGAGLAGKRGLFLHIFDDGYPFLMVGRKGGQVLSGDDFEMCARALLAGCHMYYDERLLYHHFIPKGRLTDSYFKHLLESFEASSTYNEEYRSALFFSQMSWKSKSRQFFIRIINYIIHPNNPRKRVLLRQYLSYSLHLRPFVPDELKVIYDYCKFSNWGGFRI